MTYNKRSIRVAALSLGILTSNACIFTLFKPFYSNMLAKTCEIKRIKMNKIKINCTIRASRYRGRFGLFGRRPRRELLRECYLTLKFLPSFRTPILDSFA